MTKSNEPHPNASYAMYFDIIANAKAKYNMEMLFTDFLCYRQPEMEVCRVCAVSMQCVMGD